MIFLHFLFPSLILVFIKLKENIIRPCLAGVVEVVVEVLSPAQDFSTSNDESVRKVVDGLLFHFFCPYLKEYHQEDVLWFLELVNRQAHWRAHPLQKFMKDKSSQQILKSRLETIDSNLDNMTRIHSKNKVMCGRIQPVLVLDVFLTMTNLV